MRINALVAACAVLLAGCGDAGSGGPGTSGAEPASSITSESPTSAPPSEPGTTADEAIAVVQEWLEAAQASDTDTLTELTGALSLRNVESQGGLDGLSSGLAEGMGAYARAEDPEWSAVVIPSQPDAWLVVLRGTVTREGMTETDAESWIVHPEGDRDAVVEAFAASFPEAVSPEPGTRDLAADEPVSVYLAAGGGSGTVLLDGEPLADGVTVSGADGDQLLVKALPPGGWPSGEHTVTVAGVPATPGADGPWVSVAIPVVVG
ncbi:MAG TPA: hypothetical protein VFD41_14320 [Actinomycetales bacterium]|nr:hypothetical protein [Actinomycetales bacterium]